MGCVGVLPWTAAPALTVSCVVPSVGKDGSYVAWWHLCHGLHVVLGQLREEDIVEMITSGAPFLESVVWRAHLVPGCGALCAVSGRTLTPAAPAEISSLLPEVRIQGLVPRVFSLSCWESGFTAGPGPG